MQTDTLLNRETFLKQKWIQLQKRNIVLKETTETLELQSHLRILMDWQGNLILFAFVIVQRLLIVRYSFIGNTYFFKNIRSVMEYLIAF